jgi:CHAT domain-containing protein/tetratricopeptide (TPR) repeat protein
MQRRDTIRLLGLAAAITLLAQDADLLTPGAERKASIAPGQIRSYRLHADAGRYLRLELTPKSYNLTATLTGPDGKTLAEMSNPADKEPIPLACLTAYEGDYRLDIKLDTKQGATEAGEFVLRFAALRAPAREDAQRIEAEKHMNASLVRMSAGAIPDSEREAREALPLWRELGERRQQALALTYIGMDRYYAGDFASSMASHREALNLFQAVRDQEGELTSLVNLGVALNEIGDAAQAIRYLRDIPDRARAAGTIELEGIAANNLGAAYMLTNQPEKAIPAFERALAVDKSVNNQPAIVDVLMNIGYLRMQIGEYGQARQTLLQALEQAGDTPRLRGGVLLNLANLSLRHGQSQEALDSAREAWKLYTKANDPVNIGVALDLMANIHVLSGKIGDALALYPQAIEAFKPRSRRNAASSLQHYANALVKSGALEPAIAAASESVTMAHAANAPAVESAALENLAEAEAALQRLDEARKHIAASVDLTETLRSRVSGEDRRSFITAGNFSRYALYVDILERQGQDAAAFEQSERARARSLLDLLKESSMDIRQGVDPALIERQRAIETRLSRTGLRADPKLLETLTAELRDVKARVRSESPSYAALVDAKPLSAAEIQQRFLDGETALVEYLLAEPRSYAWVLTKNSLTRWTLAGRSTIEAAARRAYADLNHPGRAASIPSLEELRKLVWQGLPQEVKRLAVVPDGALQYIPFAAFSGLLDSYEIVNLPSASAIPFLQMDRRPAAAARNVAVIADPVFSTQDPRSAVSASSQAAGSSASLARGIGDFGLQTLDRLPGTRREADAIRALSSPDHVLIATGFDANRELLESGRLAGYDILHFATHGLIDSEHPELSGVVLSMVDKQGRPTEGYIQAHEIYNLKFNAGLAVLSACRTALGREIRGEGLVGLTRGFLYAGVPRVVASLWQAPDRATAELMRRFYTHMLREGATPAAALRQAQREMRADSRWPSPYYWAAFTLQGSWN